MKNLSILTIIAVLGIIYACNKTDGEPALITTPVAITGVASQIGDRDVFLSGSLASENAEVEEVTETGIVVGTDAGVEIDGDSAFVQLISGGDSLQVELNCLVPGLKYYYAFYARTASKDYYGDEKDFTMQVAPQPSCTNTDDMIDIGNGDEALSNINCQEVMDTAAGMDYYELSAKGPQKDILLRFSEQPVAGAYVVTNDSVNISLCEVKIWYKSTLGFPHQLYQSSGTGDSIYVNQNGSNWSYTICSHGMTDGTTSVDMNLRCICAR